MTRPGEIDNLRAFSQTVGVTTAGGVRSPVFSTDDTSVCRPLGHGDDVVAHFHDFGQLRYASSGALVTATSVGTWVAPASRITWIPAFSVHSSRSHGETEVRLLSVAPGPAQRLPAEPSVFVASALVREAYLELAQERESGDTARARLLLEVVISELARAPLEPLRLPEPSDPRLRAVTDELRADPAGSLTLAELGRHSGASERTLSRLFGRELSMSFHQWRTLLRVQHALLELGQGRSVTDTALLLGWTNPSSFIDAFTDLVGQTPGRYRAAAYTPRPAIGAT